MSDVRCATLLLQAGSVVITCNTQQPYRHCLEVPDGSQGVEIKVRGIRFAHYSKSVANNYCIFAQVCVAALASCNVVHVACW
jgi:hypothetical protein